MQTPAILTADQPSPGHLPQTGTDRLMSSVSGPRTLGAMMLREMATTHGRSWGGYLWTIIDPIGGILMMTLVFSMVLRSPPIGTNFVIFYATGYVPFSYFMS